MSKKPTRDQQERYERVLDGGCIICQMPAEIHHMRSGAGLGQRGKGLLPLCPKHHRTGNYGEAIHAGQKGFEYKFGSEDYLLDRLKERMNEA